MKASQMKEQEPEPKVFFGDEQIVKKFAAECVEMNPDADHPHLSRIIRTIFPMRVFGEAQYAEIALRDGEAVALICGLHAYHFTICQSGHIFWLEDKEESLHKRMIDALDATQLSAIDRGMDVRNIMNRSFRWYKKREQLNEEDYFERLSIQDARYLTICREWLRFLDECIGKEFFSA